MKLTALSGGGGVVVVGGAVGTAVVGSIGSYRMYSDRVLVLQRLKYASNVQLVCDVQWNLTNSNTQGTKRKVQLVESSKMCYTHIQVFRDLERRSS